MIYLKTYTNQGDGDENNNNQGKKKNYFLICTECGKNILKI